MGKLHPEIDARLEEWISRQRLYFVGTAPSGPGGHVNVSPKGLEPLSVLGPHEVAYLDRVGSGAETIAHLRENGRIVIMLCAFEGPPKIVRLHGRGEVLEPGEPGFEALAARFPDGPAVRAIVRVAVTRISDSCGYGVPFYAYQGERPQLAKWAERKGPEGLRRYQIEHNLRSIDGLAALRGRALQEGREPSEP